MVKKTMQAMNLAWHEPKCLKEYTFSEVSDKLRDQLVEQGYSNRDATLKAPTMLEGVDLALAGKLDFKRMRDELRDEKAGNHFSQLDC